MPVHHESGPCPIRGESVPVVSARPPLASRAPASRAASPADELAGLLERGLTDMAIELSASTQARLLDYLKLLARWNRTFNLTAVRDPVAMVGLHLLDSLSILPLVKRLTAGSPAHIVDVGTGAGLPGIPLALADGGLRVSLVESNGKKVSFLRQCMADLALSNVSVRHTRIESLDGLDPTLGPADVIVSRAFSSLREMIAATDRLIRPTTAIVAMKGPGAQDELIDLDTNGLPGRDLAQWQALARSHQLSVQTLQVAQVDAVRQAIVMVPR